MKKSLEFSVVSLSPHDLNKRALETVTSVLSSIVDFSLCAVAEISVDDYEYTRDNRGKIVKQTPVTYSQVFRVLWQE